VTAFTVLFSARDVFDDAHNTFIKDNEEERERETQLDELMRGGKAFNWSDEELLPSSTTLQEDEVCLKTQRAPKPS
jgi:hypothetical protein